MALIALNRKPTRRQLAVFGLAWLVFFGAAGWALWRRGCPTGAMVAWAAAAAVPGAGCVVPGLLPAAYVALSYATYPIGYVVSLAVLAAIYYGAITPTGLVMRLLGRDPMQRRFDPRAPTYWAPHERRDEPESYFKQY